MPLSSSTLFHFTDSKDAIIGILNENFKCHYSFESIRLNNNPMEFYVPIVSFCDIPLSQVNEHVGKYGNYGIGLTKEWAIRNNLNPVLYMENNSDLARSYRTVYKDLLMSGGKKLSESTIQEKSLGNILRYIKNYEGKLFRKGTIIEDFRFYDEREWRYVIDFDKIEGFIIGGKYSKQFKESINASIAEHRLVFTPNDIKYIIINEESEIQEFVRILTDAKGSKYSYRDVETLLTRIISMDQIKKDF